MKRKEAKKRAIVAARRILEQSVATAGGDLDLAKRQASLARDLMLKYNIRFDWNLKRFYCRGCKQLMVPGVNSRVRLGKGRVILMTCSDCGHTNRKLLEQA